MHLLYRGHSIRLCHSQHCTGRFCWSTHWFGECVLQIQANFHSERIHLLFKRWVKMLSAVILTLLGVDRLFFFWLIVEMNVLINRELSIESFQLRHMENFINGNKTITDLIDTPKHKNQGFVVDVECGNFFSIFTHVMWKLCLYFEFHWI